MAWTYLYSYNSAWRALVFFPPDERLKLLSGSLVEIVQIESEEMGSLETRRGRAATDQADEAFLGNSQRDVRFWGCVQSDSYLEGSRPDAIGMNTNPSSITQISPCRIARAYPSSEPLVHPHHLDTHLLKNIHTLYQYIGCFMHRYFLYQLCKQDSEGKGWYYLLKHINVVLQRKRLCERIRHKIWVKLSSCSLEHGAGALLEYSYGSNSRVSVWFLNVQIKKDTGNIASTCVCAQILLLPFWRTTFFLKIAN